MKKGLLLILLSFTTILFSIEPTNDDPIQLTFTQPKHFSSVTCDQNQNFNLLFEIGSVNGKQLKIQKVNSSGELILDGFVEVYESNNPKFDSFMKTLPNNNIAIIWRELVNNEIIVYSGLLNQDFDELSERVELFRHEPSVELGIDTKNTKIVVYDDYYYNIANSMIETNITKMSFDNTVIWNQVYPYSFEGYIDTDKAGGIAVGHYENDIALIDEEDGSIRTTISNEITSINQRRLKFMPNDRFINNNHIYDFDGNILLEADGILVIDAVNNIYSINNSEVKKYDSSYSIVDSIEINEAHFDYDFRTFGNNKGYGFFTGKGYFNEDLEFNAFPENMSYLISEKGLTQNGILAITKSEDRRKIIFGRLDLDDFSYAQSEILNAYSEKVIDEYIKNNYYNLLLEKTDGIVVEREILGDETISDNNFEIEENLSIEAIFEDLTISKNVNDNTIVLYRNDELVDTISFDSCPNVIYCQRTSNAMYLIIKTQTMHVVKIDNSGAKWVLDFNTSNQNVVQVCNDNFIIFQNETIKINPENGETIWSSNCQYWAKYIVENDGFYRLYTNDNDDVIIEYVNSLGIISATSEIELPMEANYFYYYKNEDNVYLYYNLHGIIKAISLDQNLQPVETTTVVTDFYSFYSPEKFENTLAITEEYDNHITINFIINNLLETTWELDCSKYLGARIILIDNFAVMLFRDNCSNYDVTRKDQGGDDYYAYFFDLSGYVPNEQFSTQIPNTFSAKNYPNPFSLGNSRNAQTTIEFNLPQAQNVDVSIYNIKGQKVKNLLKDDLREGTHSVSWNGENSNNEKVASGVYFYKVKTDRDTTTKKLLILK